MIEADIKGLLDIIFKIEVNNYDKIEKELEMREILYEEICSHYKDKSFTTKRKNYYISVSGNSAKIEDEETGEKISYS